MCLGMSDPALQVLNEMTNDETNSTAQTTAFINQYRRKWTVGAEGRRLAGF